MQKLQNFPKDKINAETIDIMRPYLSLADYTYEKAKASSGNVAGLIQWTRAMADFYQVNKEVLPLKVRTCHFLLLIIGIFIKTSSVLMFIYYFL